MKVYLEWTTDEPPYQLKAVDNNEYDSTLGTIWWDLGEDPTEAGMKEKIVSGISELDDACDICALVDFINNLMRELYFFYSLGPTQASGWAEIDDLRRQIGRGIWRHSQCIDIEEFSRLNRLQG